MKKSELKAIIKPLVQECLLESILESGVLSTIIKESVQGIMSSGLLTEQLKSSAPIQKEEKSSVNARFSQFTGRTDTKTQNADIERTKKRLLESIGKSSFGGIDIFEGTTPAPAPGAPINEGKGNNSPVAPTSPLAGLDPSDAGVDLSVFGIKGTR